MYEQIAVPIKKYTYEIRKGVAEEMARAVPVEIVKGYLRDELIAHATYKFVAGELSHSDVVTKTLPTKLTEPATWYDHLKLEVIRPLLLRLPTWVCAALYFQFEVKYKVVERDVDVDVRSAYRICPHLAKDSMESHMYFAFPSKARKPAGYDYRSQFENHE